MSEECYYTQTEGPALHLTSCPECGTVGSLKIELRRLLVARPIGTWSLAGTQDKFSSVSMSVPHVVCRISECGFIQAPKLET